MFEPEEVVHTYAYERPQADAFNVRWRAALPHTARKIISTADYNCAMA